MGRCPKPRRAVGQGPSALPSGCANGAWAKKNGELLNKNLIIRRLGRRGYGIAELHIGAAAFADGQVYYAFDTLHGAHLRFCSKY